MPLPLELTNSLRRHADSQQREAAKKTGIDPATISRVSRGLEGFSAKNARKVADVADEGPADIYVQSQVRSIRQRSEAGEIDSATVTKAVGRVVSTLKREFPNAQIPDDTAKDLQDLAQEASKGLTGTLESLGRPDGTVSKRRLDARQEESQTAEKSAAPGIMGKLGRNADGTSRRKLV